MIAGTTSTLRFSLGHDLLEAAEAVIFTVAAADGDVILTKRYPDDVDSVYVTEDGTVFVRLTQQETLGIGESAGDDRRFLVEAQVNFKDKSVAKSEIMRGFVRRTLATETVTGNSPSGDGDGGVDLVLEEGIVMLRGERGEKGEKGDKGDKGDRGETGESAYAAAVSAGYEGTEAEFGEEMAGLSAVAASAASAAARTAASAVFDAAFVNGEASGNPISFDDGASGVPVKNVTVRFSPSQDLNGYDRPWAAGGGRNLFDLSSATVLNAYISSNERLRASQTKKTVCIECLPGTTYTVSCPDAGTVTAGTMASLPEIEESIFTDTLSGTGAAGVTVTSGQNDSYLLACIFDAAADTATFEEVLASLQIEVGSAATSYSPYSNVCPITGTDGVTLTVSDGASDPRENEFSVTFPAGAGEVYGGSLDLTEGKLKSEWRKLVLDGTTAGASVTNASISNGTVWGRLSITDRAGMNTSSASPGSSLLCDKLNPMPSVRPGNVYITSSGTILVVVLPDQTLDTVAKINAWLVENNVTVVYRLSTPGIFSVTPSEVTTFRGDNVVSADVGTIDMTYRKDPTILFENLS